MQSISEANPALQAALKNLEERLDKTQNPFASRDISRLLSEAHSRCTPRDAAAMAESLVALCQRLYGAGRPFDAIPIARTALALAVEIGNSALQRRSATVCGIVLADAGDYADAIEHHAKALDMATLLQDDAAIAGGWNNIGVAFLYAASYDLAVEGCSRAAKHADSNPLAAFSRYAAFGNLAQCYLHLGDTSAGLAAAKRALREEQPDFLARDSYNGVLLRHNYVRLLLAVGKTHEAAELVADTVRLAETSQSPRAAIVALTTRAVYEVANKEIDVGLTRLAQALDRARLLPAMLRDTLVSMIRAEEAAGHPQRAILYLNELADLVYRQAVQQARKHLRLSDCFDDADSVADSMTNEMLADARAQLARSAAENNNANEWSTFERLAVSAALEIDASGWHGMRVGEYTRYLALAYGCVETLASEIGLAARLHDIGMSTVPKGILSKPAPLNAGERCVVENHCRSGAEMLSTSRQARALLAVEIAKYHHEWWDGQGYPQRIGGKAIPLAARMCAVADAFDALTTTRPYQAALSWDEALTRLQQMAGTQLDPELVDCFVGAVAAKRLKQGAQPICESEALSGFRRLIEKFSNSGGACA